MWPTTAGAHSLSTTSPPCSRGHAEAIYAPADAVGELDGAIVRIHPKRIISVGIDHLDHEPHLLTPNIRNVIDPPENHARN